MKSRWTQLLFSAALVALVGAGQAWGQASRGNLRGEVLDSENSPLPGVQLTISSPALIQPRSVVSGSNGEFNVPALPVGMYTVDATLASFAPAKVEGIRVQIGGTATVKVSMRLESMQVTAEVIGDTIPVLDPTDTGTGGRITNEELIKVPTARDPWAVLALVPGVQSDRVNVGGSESGQQSNFVAKGAAGSQTVWSIDGVTITDAGAQGSSPTYYDFGALEEVQVSTGGNDVSQLSGGIGINIVTKRGSNDFHGSVRSFFTNGSLQGSNISDDLDKAYNQDTDKRNDFLVGKNDQLLEVGGEVGGPVIKDKLWFWGSLNRNKIEQLLNRYDAAKTREGVFEQQGDNTTLINYAGKLSGQLTETNEANAFYHFGDKKKEGRLTLPVRDSNSAWNQGGGTPVYKIEDQQIFGSDGLLAAKFAYVGGGFHLYPAGGSKEGGDAKQGLQDGSNGDFFNNFYHYETDRPQMMFNLDSSLFRSMGSTDNDFKFGFSYRHTPVESRSFWDQGVYVTNNVGGVTDFIANVAADYTVKYVGDTVSLYASDTLSTGNLTVDLGVRYDRQTTKNLESFRAANPFSALLGNSMGELTRPADSDSAATFNLLSPRLGLTYQLGDKTLIKANYALYADQIAASLATQLNPIGSQYLYVYFDDKNGDSQFQANEAVNLGDDAAGCAGYCSGGYQIDLDNPNSLESLNTIDEDLTSPKTHEVLLGITREVAKDTSVGVNFTYRNRTQALVALPLIRDASGTERPITFDDWTPITAPVTGTGDADGNYAGDFVIKPFSIQSYTLKSGLEFVGGNFNTNRDGYSERYMGFEVLLQKRFSERWSFAGNLALNDWTQSFTEGGEGDFPNPNVTATNTHVDGGDIAPSAGAASGPKGSVFFNASWQSNLRGTYTIPGVEVDLGASLLLRQGFPSPFFTNKNLLNGVGTTSLLLSNDITAVRMGTVASLDLRVGREIKFSDTMGLELSVDAFNLLNNDVLLQHNRQLANSGAPNSASLLKPTEILAPRLLRLSGRLKF